ncbi:MAG TPA: HYR domain-containing protein, partial [Acidimicrobiia bacterium]|nr:HYR domain-containing protein [Acidimicrobiia bacterium]
MLRIRRSGLVGVVVLVVTVVLGGMAFAAVGDISTIAGTTAGFSGDGAAATGAQLFGPFGVAVDGVGNVFIADYLNHRVRRVDAVTELISTIAGTGVAGFSGDGAAATSAQLFRPTGVGVDGGGNVFIADYLNHRVRRVDAVTGFIDTIAGTGVDGFSGDGAAATDAQLNYPTGVAVDGAGNVFIGDTDNHRVRRVHAVTGFIDTIGGNGTAGFSGDGGVATSAKLNYPYGVAADGAGNVYIADYYNHRVRRVDAGTAFIDTFAGTGVAGFSGDGAAATSAQLNYPTGVAVDGAGNVFIADAHNDRIRKVDGDTTDPVVTAPSDVVVEADGPDGSIVTYSGATATDDVGVVSGPTCVPPSGSLFAVGVTMVTCSASDAAGNVGEATFTVTVTRLPATVGLVDPGAGLWYLRNSVGVVSSFYFGNPGDYPIVGDWDCDGDDTPGMYRQSDGYVYLRNSNTQGVADIRFFFGNPGDI